MIFDLDGKKVAQLLSKHGIAKVAGLTLLSTLFIAGMSSAGSSNRKPIDRSTPLEDPYFNPNESTTRRTGIKSPTRRSPGSSSGRTVGSFLGNFESGNLSGWSLETCCSHSARVVTSPPAREGRYSAQMTLRKTDPETYTSKRSELKVSSAVPMSSEYTYRFSLFLPSSYTRDPSFDIVTQWPMRPDFSLGENWRTPAMSIMTQDGRWKIHRRWDPNRVTYNNQPGPGGGSETIDLGSYAVNRWSDWVVHVKWSYRSDGFLRVWRDGQLVVNKTGPNAYNDAEGPYLKLGVYKPDWKWRPTSSTTTQRIVYVDGVRRYPGTP